MKKSNIKNVGAFTLVEVVVGSALFLIIALASYGAFASLYKLAQANQAKIAAVELASEQMEVVRNMPYVKIGLTDGIPQGSLLDSEVFERAGFTFDVSRVVRAVNLSTSTVQASSKLVEISVNCDTCRSFSPVVLTAQIAPANLQSSGEGGALLLKVIDSNGDSISGASVSLSHTSSSTISNEDVTNNSGNLAIIGVPPALEAYKIVVTKDGYTSDQTETSSAENPSPTKPDLTVLDGQVTEVTFTIDRLSTLTITSKNLSCENLGGVGFHIEGAKLDGEGLPKYSVNFVTNGVGQVVLQNLEWDTYTLNPVNDGYSIYGLTPANPVTLLAGNEQIMEMVAVAKQPASLLVAVKDRATGLPLSQATVDISGNGESRTALTGRGFWEQTDWSSGEGQEMMSDPSAYGTQDGSIEISNTGEISLKNLFGEYVTSGWLESSIFDLGESASVYDLSWSPSSQPASVGPNSVRFQLASLEQITPTSTWSYVGPDGTGMSYYESPSSIISGEHSNHRYVRYKVFLSTNNSTSTPSVTDVSLSFSSPCVPPGQTFFSSLPTGSYNIGVSKAGYSSFNDQIEIQDEWKSTSVELFP